MNVTDDDNVTRDESVHLGKSSIMLENEHVHARTTLYSREDFNRAGYLLPRFCIILILTFVEPRFADRHHSKCVCRDVQKFQCFSQTLWWFVDGFCAKDMSRFSNRPQIVCQLNV